MKQCERCGIEELSDDYPFELESYNGEKLCQDCMEEARTEE